VVNVELVVLDSSIILALTNHEPLKMDMLPFLSRGVMSTVGVAEVYSKLTEWKIQDTGPTDALLAALARIVPLTFQQARFSGEMRVRTSHVGLSLGDRVCLALASDLGMEVYTKDGDWLKVDVGVKVHHVGLPRS